MRPHHTTLRDLRADQKLAARFWARVGHHEPLFCWEWTGYRNDKDYGRLTVNGRAEYAHRVAWGLTFGPTDLCVLHRCDNPPCVNPSHLFLGTQHDNMRDMWSKGRHTPPTHKAVAKLTADDVRRIRELAATGMSQRVIAAQFGVTQTNVSQITRRLTWRDV